MQNGKKRKGLYATVVSSLLALTMVFTAGCSNDKDNNDIYDVPETTISDSYNELEQNDEYGEVRDLLSKMIFEDVVEGIGEHTFLDDYLKSVNYENLLSDYVGFRDCGDLEGAKQSLYQLGMHILKGSVLDTFYREDEEFAARVGVDFTLDDVIVDVDALGDSPISLYITVDGGENYKQLVKDGDFIAGYDTNGLGNDMLGMLYSLESGDYRDESSLQNVLNFYKEFMVATGSYTGDYSIMDSLSIYDGIHWFDKEINFDYNPEIGETLKKQYK